MANRAEHMMIGAFVGASVTMFNKEEAPTGAINPESGALIGKLAATIPDILEPSIHPNHRRFFHSWFMLAALGFAIHEVWQWKPEDAPKSILKWAMLIGGTAYGSHLLRDAITPKGLPVV